MIAAAATAVLFGILLSALTRAAARRRRIVTAVGGWTAVAWCGACAATAAAAGALDAVTLCAMSAAVVCADTDARTGYIFDDVTAAVAVAAMLCALTAGRVADAACGALAGGGVLWSLHLLTRGRGVGLGDVKLAGALGACLHPAGALVALGAAFVSGAAYGVALIVRDGFRRGTTVAFGPFLACGCVVAAAANGAGLLP